MKNIKQLIVFILASVFLMACGKSTGNPEIDTISLGTAFSIVSHSWSYWIFIVLSLIPLGLYLWQWFKGNMDEISLPILFGGVALILFAIFMRPCEIAANTSIAAFERGNIIGY